MKPRKFFIGKAIGLILLVVIAGIWYLFSNYHTNAPIKSVGTQATTTDQIHITYPLPNQIVTSPLTITGEARGSWFFEASFPVVLTNWDGLIIAEGIATAKGDWMTNDFVPFEAKLTFNVDKNAYSNRGFLILKKDNPSGMPLHDDSIEIPVILGE